MADATLEHPATAGHAAGGGYEAPLLGAYSKKVGMWLFLASDSLTFGALLFAFSYNRIYTNPWPTPFHVASIINATVMTACLLSSSLTMVLAVFAAQRHDRAWTRNWLLATMVFGTAFIVLHGMEWTKLINEGLYLPGFVTMLGAQPATSGEYADISKNVPQFTQAFFGLTAMHMLHVTIGVIYLGVVALRKAFLPILAIIWIAAAFLIPASNIFHYPIHVLGVALVISAIILFLKPKDYDAEDVEVSGLYWHFVDLVWMFIFPLVYLMSTKV
ncbi:MAG TPA: cytochrome oxidase subunit III [Candidatus Binatia bacterium]|nr:cytochrome oxidase subunit III [Candidatus Binatia bacterium]